MTIITFPVSETNAPHPHLRRFNLYRDLRQVADLIEFTFADAMDLSGREYIRQMRSAANHPNFLQWASRLAARASVPFGGFVWEQDGKVVGNLSQIALPKGGKKIWLIANVAVLPDYRGQGIAKALTAAALANIQRRGADQIWLHVRDDNPAALHLYRSAGFAEHTRRTSWYSPTTLQSADPAGASRVTVRTRRRDDWLRQVSWLNQLHPESLDWYLPLDANLLRPGVWGFVHRLIVGADIRQWTAERNGELLGMLAWASSTAAYDRLWMTANPANKDDEAAAIAALLASLRGKISRRKRMNLEYPAGRAEDVFRAAGFTPHHTLLWMRYKN